MKWSWKIGRAAGVNIHVHATFPLLLVWVAVIYYQQRGRWEDALAGLVFILALFAVVVLHEFGHALTARRFGIRTRDITLLPIGGLARMERMPDRPWQELLVALAGPAVNVVLASLLFAVLAVLGYGSAIFTDVNLIAGNFLARLAWVNVTLALFNLLPAFPMDGGRVLRAVLAMRLSYVQATSIAAAIGQGMAVLIGLLGLFGNPFLVLIALFVWMGAAQEASAAQLKSALSGLPVERVMTTEFHVLAPDDPLERAVEHVLASRQHDFPVLEEGRLVGMLNRSRLLSALSRNGPASPVGDAMQRNFPSVTAGDSVNHLLPRMREEDGRALPVVRDGELVGLLTTEGVSDYILVHAALDKSLRHEHAAHSP
ncbi:MAG TPA: site-2 protease family protein [Opitutaceae bacterium]